MILWSDKKDIIFNLDFSQNRILYFSFFSRQSSEKNSFEKMQQLLLSNKSLLVLSKWFAHFFCTFVKWKFLQGMIICEASRRICATRAQQQAKPGRQIITFMLFANITLWVLDTFMTHRDITQGVQTQFFGLLAWGIISRISLPLLIFYRFHSCVVLVEIWKNTYRTKESL